MKVIARVKGENQQLLDSLQAGNISARLVKNAIIVDLPKVSESVYGIPDLLKGVDVSYFIECVESSGVSGDVLLICDKAGKPMRPYYVPKTGNSANGVHAYFAVPLCISVKAVFSSMTVTIAEHSLEPVIEGIKLKYRKLWEGLKEDLPEAFLRFQKAVGTSLEKAGSMDSRTACYIQVGKKEV